MIKIVSEYSIQSAVIMDVQSLISLMIVLLSVPFSVKCEILSVFSDQNEFGHASKDFSYGGLSDDSVDVTKQQSSVYPVDLHNKFTYPGHFPEDYHHDVFNRPHLNLFKPFQLSVKLFEPLSYTLHNPLPVHVQFLSVPKHYKTFLKEHYSHAAEKYAPHLIKFPQGRPFPVHITLTKPHSYTVHAAAIELYNVMPSLPRLPTAEKQVAVVVKQPAPHPVEISAKVSDKDEATHRNQLSESHSECGCQS